MKPLESNNLNGLWAQLMIEELVRNEVTTFYIGPGSRSTPLTVAVARHARARAQICYDERGAGFRALGHARATRLPAAVITTSGTAAANLYPAVVEAAQDHVPLILLTADRPPELIDTGANQAILQTQMFDRYVRWQFELPCPSAKMGPGFVLTTVDQAVHQSRSPNAGPVHLNCMFREPFLDPDGEGSGYDLSTLTRWANSTNPWTRYGRTVPCLEGADLKRVIDCVNHTQQGMLMVGRLDSARQRQAVKLLMTRLDWPVYADIASGLRFEAGTHVLRYFDQDLVTDACNRACRAQTVLHIGGRITSKRVPLFMAANPPENYIVVKEHSSRYDPVHCVTQSLECDFMRFVMQLGEQCKDNGAVTYRDALRQQATEIDSLIGEMIQAEPSLTEPYVARQVTRLIPENQALFISNSMPIRDVDIYGIGQREPVHVGVNRGASGIDGILASAVGFAEGQSQPTTVLMGDVALLHDLNSLSMVSQCGQPLCIVVINNQGCGIFHFLPISQQADVFEDYFVTPHRFSFAGLGPTFQLEYVRAETQDAFTSAYCQFLTSQRPTLIEVPTNSVENFNFRKKMKQAILNLFGQLSGNQEEEKV